MINTKEFLEILHAGHNDIDHDGTCYATILKNWQNDSVQDYYTADDCLSDKSYKVKQFINKCSNIVENGAEDTYVSINSYYNINRSTKNVRHLNAFVIDYDYYKLKKYKNKTSIEMLEIIRPTLKSIPTLVVDSGRGLYLIYCIKHKSKHCVKLYQQIWKYLLDDQVQFGADRKATLVTQVIRLPGTINSKSLSEVKVIEYNKTNYDIENFTYLLPFTNDQVKNFKSNFKQKSNVVNKRHYKINRRKKYLDNCISDFKNLIELRNKQNINEGYREYLLFVIIYLNQYYGRNIAESIAIAKKMNRRFNKPMTEKEVEIQCIPSEIFSNCISIKKIIEKLQITDEEMNDLDYLIGDQYKKIKNNEKNQRAKRNTLSNRTAFEQELYQRRLLIKDLLKNGYRQSEIANKLNMSKQQVSNDVKYIKNHAYKFIEKLEDYIRDITSALAADISRRMLTTNTYQYASQWLKTREILKE